MDVFGGYGRAARDAAELLQTTLVPGQVTHAWSVGAGVRYLIAKELGLRFGIDVARGPEDWAFYIVTGDAWFRP